MKWGWLLTAVALIGYLFVRRNKLGRPLLAAGAVGVAAAMLVGTGVVELPNIEHLIADAGTALGRWTYLLVGVLAFLETGAFIGLVAPGETAVLVGGLVAGQGRISLVVLIAIVWTCAVAGDLTSYTLGRRLGRSWLLRHGERLKITEDRLLQVERFFDRAGGVTILVGRFIGLVRALAPFIAGTSRMPLRVFLPYDIIGAGAWATTFSVLGYIFWRSFDKITEYVSRGLFAFGTVVAIGIALYLLVRLRRDTEFRAKFKAWLYEREDQPLMRPLLRLGIPVWRKVLRPAAAVIDRGAMFARGRLTPGHLGLELTTLLALLAVGAFSFFLLAAVVGEPGEPRVDTFAEDVADDMRFEGLNSLLKVLTDIGSSPVMGIVVLITAVWAASRGRRIEAAALVVGGALSFAASRIAKAAYDRPRQEGSLVDTLHASFPSGHALYSVALVACAVVLVRAGVGWAARFALVTVSVVIVALVAASRVYLRAHYLTDVLAGIALAVALWSLVGIAAIAAGAIRHNGRVS